jgi:hypothetical protein
MFLLSQLHVAIRKSSMSIILDEHYGGAIQIHQAETRLPCQGLHSLA